MKYYRIFQDFNIRVPLNNKNMKFNIANDLALEITEEESKTTLLGSGTWSCDENGVFKNITWNFDSSD